jgi:O-methyltransferase
LQRINSPPVKGFSLFERQPKCHPKTLPLEPIFDRDCPDNNKKKQMKRLLINLNAFIKGLILVIRPHILLGFLRRPFLFWSNVFSLTKWIAAQDKKNMLNDFFSWKRDYQQRYKLYQYLFDTQKLEHEAIDYLEFGVCGGVSFEWWAAANKNKNSAFYGFDTFEGLPENWGMMFKKGDMAANIPNMNDERVLFVKGLFQDTVQSFLKAHNLENGKRKVIHLDADLYSSTLYALSSLAPYLKKGDILLFDEFNVPNHEFYAFKCFTESFYVKTKLLAAVNNYYQVAMEITG